MSNDTPPQAYLKIVSQQCSKALGTYLQLWEKMDQDSLVFVPYLEINDLFLTSKAKFKHDLLMLASSMLVSYEYLDGVFVVSVVGWDEEAFTVR